MSDGMAFYRVDREPDALEEFDGTDDSASPASLMELIATRAHLEEKKVSASDASLHYAQRETSLRTQLTELRLKAESICLKLEEEKSRLMDLCNQWRDELERLPSVEYLEEQLSQLRQIAVEAALEDGKAKETDIYVDLGILRPGDSLSKLPGKLLELSSGLPRDDIPDSRIDGCTLERRIALMKLIGRRLKEGSESEIRMIGEENKWMERKLRLFQERNEKI
jgi:hypothetical protein